MFFEGISRLKREIHRTTSRMPWGKVFSSNHAAKKGEGSNNFLPFLLGGDSTVSNLSGLKERKPPPFRRGERSEAITISDWKGGQSRV